MTVEDKIREVVFATAIGVLAGIALAIAWIMWRP